MKTVSFMDVAESEKFRRFFQLVRETTGVPLALADASAHRRVLLCPSSEQNPLCLFMRRHPDCDAACLKTDREMCDLAARGKRAQSYLCHAGLVDMAAPIFVEGKHVATLIGGQALPEAPTEEGFAAFSRNLSAYHFDQAGLRDAYFANPHLSKAKVESALQLASFFAEYVYELGSRIAERPAAPTSQLDQMLRFVQDNYRRPLRLEDVAAAVGLAPAYASHLFKRWTGGNLSAHIQDVRVAEAGKLLEKTAREISSIAYAAGFGSLTHFNRVFKARTGLSPRQFRKRTRGAL